MHDLINQTLIILILKIKKSKCFFKKKRKFNKFKVNITVP